jgi:DNA invertase Pin-like site-specific DNA recombinase
MPASQLWTRPWTIRGPRPRQQDSAASAQAQAEATREAQRAGIAHARANEHEIKYRGRKPTFTWQTFSLVQDLLGQGAGVGHIARTTGLNRQTIYRIQRDPERQAEALATWYPGETMPVVQQGMPS